MIAPARLPIAGLPILLAAALCCGCVSSGAQATPGKTPPPLSPERKAETVAMFESQRDTAQLQAAMNRWKEGNLAACERALASLVQQRPQFVEAHVQYAEFLLSQNNPSAAEDQLNQALKLAPDRADIFHSLAVAQEAGGNSAAAAESFRNAAKLEPENPVYQMAMEDLQLR
jgi:Tfp pilus assembly protein PilF